MMRTRVLVNVPRRFRGRFGRKSCCPAAAWKEAACRWALLARCCSRLLHLPGRGGWARGWLPLQQNIALLSGPSPPAALQLRVGGIWVSVWLRGSTVITAAGGFLYHPLGLDGPFQRLGLGSPPPTFFYHNP